jgi:hypothetical protein
MRKTGALRGVAIAVAGALAAVAPAASAVAGNTAPSALPGAQAAQHGGHNPTTTDGLSPAVRALAADAPNTIPAVTTTSAANVWLSEAVQSSGDNDIFRFFNAQTNWVRILLGDQLFADGTGEHVNDYALILYNYAGQEIKRSVRAGGIGEELYVSLPRNYYYVRVLRQTGGAYQAPTHPYVVRFQQYGETMAFNGLHLYQVAAGNWYLAGEALNNTSQYRTVTVSTTVYDAANHVLKSGHGATFHGVVPPRGRSPFVISLGAIASSLDHYLTSINGAPTTARPISGLSVHYVNTTEAGGLSTLHGTITNASTVARTQVRVAESLFNARGELLYLGYESASYPLAVHQVHTYTVNMSRTDGAFAIREDYTGR